MELLQVPMVFLISKCYSTKFRIKKSQIGRTILNAILQITVSVLKRLSKEMRLIKIPGLGFIKVLVN